jgi:hypothetical protein
MDVVEGKKAGKRKKERKPGLTFSIRAYVMVIPGN